MGRNISRAVEHKTSLQGVEDKSGKNLVMISLVQRTVLLLGCMADRAAAVWAVKLGYVDDATKT